MTERFAVSMIVNNRFGVLDRIAGLYSKRCYNIDSISAGITEDPNYTRITIMSIGDEYMKEQVVRQLEKLIDVKQVVLLDPENTVFAQHMFIKINVTGTERGSTKHQVLDIINRYRGRLVDFGEEFITAEITGNSDEIDSFIKRVRPYGILELSRSGELAIGMGIENTLSIKNEISKGE